MYQAFKNTIRKSRWISHILVGLAALLLLTLVNYVHQWDGAERELKRLQPSSSLLLYGHSKWSGGEPEQGTRSSTYLVQPHDWALPYTIEIRSERGEISVSTDRFGVLKLLFIFFVIYPLLSRLARQWGFSQVSLKM